MKPYFLICLCLIAGILKAQPRYTAAQIHSHNDYQQGNPFFGAYALQCGAIEADVYLQNGELMVAHTPAEIRPERTLTQLYLQPLANQMKQGKNYPLQLLIDLKTAAAPALDTLLSQLRLFPMLTNPANGLKIVISGNMPAPPDFHKYPAWLFFDGRFSTAYSEAELARVALFSMSFLSIGKWDEKEGLKPETRDKINEWTQKAHQKGKKIRFWATPDTPTTWQELQTLGVDWIGTDKPQALADFLKK